MISNGMAFVGLLLNGLLITIVLTIAASALAFVIAIAAGVGRSLEGGQWLWLRALVTAYVELFRGTSCFVQLFWFFFALPFLGISLPPFVAAVAVLGLNVGAYGSEVVRGALAAVPRGQAEAALALNYSPWQSFIYVKSPQAARFAIGPATNLFIDLLKITPLASLVTISDLTYNAMLIRQQTGDTLFTLTTILIVYFILSSGIIQISKAIQRRFDRGADSLFVAKPQASP